jgi:hypothetical protein
MCMMSASAKSFSAFAPATEAERDRYPSVSIKGARRFTRKRLSSESSFWKQEAIKMNDTKKCAHPNCSCKADADSKYCSAACAAVEDMPDIDCRCGHPACTGKAH